MASRCPALVAGQAPDHRHAGHSAFNDVHVVLALLGAGQMQRCEAWLERCAARALMPTDVGRGNHPMAREVGLPLLRGLLDMARGDAGGAVDLIAPVRPQASCPHQRISLERPGL